MENTFKASRNQYIITAYHYVREPSDAEKGIKGCSLGKFKKQIGDILKFYKVVPLNELHGRAGKEEKGFYCSLTFDDGTLDHYANVLPILREFGATGTFFPITMTFEGKMDITHKNHILLSKKTTDELVELYEDFMKKEFSALTDEYSIPRDKRLKETRIFDDILTANYKEIITRLPENIKTKFMDRCFEEFSFDEPEICAKFFMSIGHLKELQKAGMSIGAHTHTHTSLKTLDRENQEKEIKKSKEILEKTLDQKVDLFSYPFGNYTEQTPEILEKNGFKFAVTVEPRALMPGDNRFTLPRYDVNHLENIIL